MKTTLLILLILALTSCATRKISDDLIIVHSKHKANNYYKYYYSCYQNGLKIRVYSDSDYSVGEPLIIKGTTKKGRIVNDPVRNF